MKLARVIGTVVATIKDQTLEGEKLLIIQPLTHDLKPDGDILTAVDSAQAGVGDIVHWIMKREACYVLGDKWFSPIDASVTGIVDAVTVQDKGIDGKDKIFDGKTK